VEWSLNIYMVFLFDGWVGCAGQFSKYIYLPLGERINQSMNMDMSICIPHTFLSFPSLPFPQTPISHPSLFSLLSNDWYAPKSDDQITATATQGSQDRDKCSFNSMSL
jgi:hypothetical protein